MLAYRRLWIFLFCLFLSCNVSPSGAAIPQETQEVLDQLQKFSDAFAAVAAEARPGVVTLFSERVVQTRDPFAGTPFRDPFLRRFFQIPEHRGEQRQQGLGSGVIISEDGYILTNNHVIQGADKIRIELGDRRSFDAEIVGTDKPTDLAVLKVDGKNLPTVPMGNSDDLKVGQWVLAIGNPFGLQHTVTYGIVSAVGRGGIGLAYYEDFIQTDAAINPGNSGGAMVNLKGELVGINTAIVTRSGGYQGIGFAIPVNMARNIMEQLVETGEVKRGFLGVSIQDVTREMAEAMDLQANKGVLVAGVEEDSPADEAGLERGDLILAVNGRAVNSVYELRNRISQTTPGSNVALKILREGKEKKVSVALGELEAETTAGVSRQEEALGWEVQALDGELARRLGYPQGSGVVVTNVRPGSAASNRGIRRGDLILEINRRPVEDLEAYTRMMSQLNAGDNALLLVRRGRRTFFVPIRIPNR